MDQNISWMISGRQGNLINWSTYPIELFAPIAHRVLSEEMPSRGAHQDSYRVYVTHINKYVVMQAGFPGSALATDEEPETVDGRSYPDSTLLVVPRWGGLDVVRFAQVLAHECAHSRGLGHEEMVGTKYDTSTVLSRTTYLWALDRDRLQQFGTVTRSGRVVITHNP